MARSVAAEVKDLPVQIPLAVVGGRLATDLVDLTDDLAALDSARLLGRRAPVRGHPDLRSLRQRPPRPPVARPAVGGARPGRLDELAVRRASSWTACAPSARRSRPATCTR